MVDGQMTVFFLHENLLEIGDINLRIQGTLSRDVTVFNFFTLLHG